MSSLNSDSDSTRIAIYTNNQLEREITNILADPAGGAAILEAYIIFLWERPLLTLGHYLSLVPNIVNLQLHVGPQHQYSPTIFIGLRLPHLRTLDTNYDHTFLGVFLTNHPTLQEVRFFRCAAPDICTLQDLDLSHITSIAGPSDCVAPHINGCSQVELALTSERCIPPSMLFSTIASPLRHLEALTVNFNIEEYDLLDRIVAVAPLLQSLKLLERLSFNNRGLVRRPWTNALLWAYGLCQLPFLEKLSIRTASAFSLPIGDINDERSTIMCWIHGSHRSTEGSGVPHPRLQQITVLYSAIECYALVSGGVISYWSKPTGEWERTKFIANPEPDVVFV